MAVMTTAADLVETLRCRGIELRTDGRRIGVEPLGVLTDEDRQEIVRLKPDLIALLAGPAERASVFQGQLDEWRAAGHAGVPYFALPSVSAPPGCLSCGVALHINRAYRCETCSEAVALVLGADSLPVTTCASCGIGFVRCALALHHGALLCSACLAARTAAQIARPRREDVAQ